ncbi:response regulator [Paraburkholderia tropica]|uniref:response regulator n=1 Tax=Paraburkholderia tropica TaxID=92647 RepID=UPI002AB19345|nr:response regulator [Paraburkholderia tropica]
MRAWSPQIIVTDWMIPRMGGEQLLGRLRTVPACRGTPVIVMSALSLAARPTVTAFLRKPFSAGLLLN